MSSPEHSIYAVLVATADVTALCGTRLYPDEAPTNPTLPYVVFQRISTQADVTHEQMDASVATHLDGCLFQITAIGATQLACLSLLYQIRLALEHSAGLSAIWRDERTISREEGAQANGRAADFLVWFNPD